MSFDRLRIYIYALLMVMLLVSCVGAAETAVKTEVAKQSVLKIVETTDKLTKPVTVVNISKGYITSELHTESKNFVTNTLKKAGAIRPIQETTAKMEGIEKHRTTAEYIENNVDLVGKHTIISDGKIINITIYSQSYEQKGGKNKFNLTATIDGKSVLIHNPFRVYGIPCTVKQLSTQTVYNSFEEITKFVPPEKYLPNGEGVYNQSLFNKLLSTPITKTVEIEVDATKDAVLENLAYALQLLPAGEPTFDDPDPTETFYSSGSWVSPVTAYTANAVIVGSGGSGTGGYLGYDIHYNSGCEQISNTQTSSGIGVGGFASVPTAVTNFPVVGGTTYTVVVGSAVSGGGYIDFQCISERTEGCGGIVCPSSTTYSATSGYESSVFSNISYGGIAGSITGNYLTNTKNNTNYGGAGYSSEISGNAGQSTVAGSGASGGTGYGSGGGGGGPGQLLVCNGGSGGSSAKGIVLVEYTTYPAIGSWGASIYSLGDTGYYTYTIDSLSWTPLTHTYSIDIVDITNPSVIISSKTITTVSGTETFLFDSSNYEIGTITGYIRATNIVSQAVSTLGSANTQISGIVRIKGYVIDAVNGSIISSTNVSVVQGATYINNLTTVNGYYDTFPTSFQTGTEVTYNITKSGYYQYLLTYTPTTTPISINISLIPTTAIPGNSIGGIVGEYPYGIPVSGATITAVNATGSWSNSSNTQGFYFISGIVPGTSYNVSSLKSGYVSSSSTTVLAGSGFTEQNPQMNATYVFTGQFIDSITGEIISRVTVEDNLGFTVTTSSGTFSNSYQYGSVTFTCTASRYNSKTITYVMDSSKSVNISMIQGDSTSNTMYFTPHKVRFFCRDMFGKPIVGMTAQVYGIETTLGSVDWVLSLFGINLDTTPITSTLMTGTTGSDGSVVFIMMETEKYSVQYTSVANSINETRYYYPKQEEYIEIFWPETAAISSTVINYNFVNSTVNSTYTLLGVTYSDTLGTTTNFTFYIDNDTVPTNSLLHTQQRVYTYQSNNTVTNTNITINYTVPNIAGGGYFWGVIAVSNKYAEPFRPARYISFDADQWKINPMGAANGDATASTVYNGAAIGIVVVFALIFGRASIKFGVVIVPFMAIFFWWIGWLQITTLLISIAVTLGIFMYMRYSEDDG